MNYGEGYAKTLKCDEFIAEFDESHEDIKWFQIYEKVKTAIKEALFAAQSGFKEMHNPQVKSIFLIFQSRAIYGVDAMITDDFNVKVLEFTYSPDCERACKFYPSFYDDIFNCLFNNEFHNITQI